MGSIGGLSTVNCTFYWNWKEKKEKREEVRSRDWNARDKIRSDARVHGPRYLEAIQPPRCNLDGHF
jgi:hypothetical protein